MIVRLVDGYETKEPPKAIDLTSSNASPSYAAQIKLDKNGVTLARQNGETVDVSRGDGKHDWSQARIEVKGDNYFTFWPGH